METPRFSLKLLGQRPAACEALPDAGYQRPSSGGARLRAPLLPIRGAASHVMHRCITALTRQVRLGDLARA